jgi:hypothetical protein
VENLSPVQKVWELKNAIYAGYIYLVTTIQFYNDLQIIDFSNQQSIFAQFARAIKILVGHFNMCCDLREEQRAFLQNSWVIIKTDLD